MRRTVLALAALAGLACDRPSFVLGQGCEINSDCASPLVCVIGFCRRQCVDSRDCGAGLRCLVATGSPAGGGCQLEHERSCALTSECSTGLVCQSETCTTACAEDRDCAHGATCTVDTAGQRACHEAVAELCVYPSDCPPPMICGSDQLCRLECVGDRDCTTPRFCVANLCELPDASFGPDGGP